MDVSTLYHRAVEHFAGHVRAVKDDQWEEPTPCSEWSVRDLVNHVTSENLWTVPLVEGSTIEEVGDRFDGDVLGSDPVGAALTAASGAAAAMGAALPRGGTVHLSFGETPTDEYAMQLTADNLVHGWDLAAAIGADRHLEHEVVGAVAEWFDEREELYRGGGAIAERRELTGDPQHDLLARFGRDAEWTAPA